MSPQVTFREEAESSSATVEPIVSPSQRAQRLLRHSPYSSLRDVHCRYHDGVLTLEGRVPSYFLKQVAQSLFAEVPDVARIENRIQVEHGQRGDRASRPAGPHVRRLPYEMLEVPASADPPLYRPHFR